MITHNVASRNAPRMAVQPYRHVKILFNVKSVPGDEADVTTRQVSTTGHSLGMAGCAVTRRKEGTSADKMQRGAQGLEDLGGC